MNLPRFLARRLRQRTDRKAFTATVTRIGVASIAIGLAVMWVAFGVLFGFKASIRQKLFSLSGQVQVTALTLNESFEETAMPLHTPAYERATTLPGVSHVQAVAHKSGLLKTQQGLQGVVLKGVGADFDWQAFGQNLVAGQLPDFRKDTSDSKQIVISRYMARTLALGPGDAVTMYFLQQPPRARRLQVVGIYETGLEELDKQLLVGDLRLVQRLNNWGPDTVGTLEVFTPDFESIDAVKTQTTALLTPFQRALSVVDRFRPLFDWLTLLDTNLVIFLTLVLFVASFNMVSILLVLMLERTAMIGLFKALGSPNGQIRRLFWWQGLHMVGRGMLLGNGLGALLCGLQSRFRLVPLDPENYYIDYVPIAFQPWAIVLLNAGTLVLVAAVLYLPTLLITRLRPVEAIRFAR